MLKRLVIQFLCAAPLSNRFQYFPYLLDITVKHEYDPSFMFTHEDDFENISANYAKFNTHEVPGGLKVCLTTEFGRTRPVG
jgi:threonine dehydrogenase-like Zn-dependent dehydrogenase